jgi:hypothetical protein
MRSIAGTVKRRCGSPRAAVRRRTSDAPVYDSIRKTSSTEGAMLKFAT